MIALKVVINIEFTTELYENLETIITIFFFDYVWRGVY